MSFLIWVLLKFDIFSTMIRTGDHGVPVRRGHALISQVPTSRSEDVSKTWHAHAMLVKSQHYEVESWRARAERARVNVQKLILKISRYFLILVCPRHV